MNVLHPDDRDYAAPCTEGYYAAQVLQQERAADRVRWRGRESWHPTLTYSTIIIASSWLAGAWYEWQIDGNGAQMVVCLVGALSTIWPGVPWRELAEQAKRTRAIEGAEDGRHEHAGA